MKVNNAILWAAALAAASMSNLPAQAADSAGSSGLANAERANRLIGTEIKASNGQRVGKLDDLVVDLESGRVLYGVVDTGKQKVGVAPELFRDTTSRPLQLSVDNQKIDNAPKFDRQGPDMGSAAYVSQVYRYFGQNEWWAGATPADQGSFNNVHRVTDLKNVRVVNVSDQHIGDIQTPVVDVPAGRVLYVLLEPASDLGLGKNLYALPPQTFTANNKSGKTAFSVNVDKEKLTAAPHLTGNDWSKLRDQSFASQVYNHYGKQPYFTSTSGSLQPTGRESGQYTGSDVNSSTNSRTWDRGTRNRVPRNSGQNPGQPQSSDRYERDTSRQGVR